MPVRNGNGPELGIKAAYSQSPFHWNESDPTRIPVSEPVNRNDHLVLVHADIWNSSLAPQLGRGVERGTACFRLGPQMQGCNAGPGGLLRSFRSANQMNT